MEKRAILKNIRISPFKLREVARTIQNKRVQEALGYLYVTPRKGGKIIAKVLRSAVANVENAPDSHVTEEELIVKSIEVGEGPTMKRTRPKARGMAGRMLHRSSHVSIVVAEAEF